MSKLRNWIAGRWPEVTRAPFSLADVSTAQMREAVAVWRTLNREAYSLHDKIEDLIDEVERLRSLLNTKKEPVEA